MDALERPGCAVCRLAARRADRMLGSYIYEHVNDVELRARIRAARGFCETHAGHLLAKLDALAVAITYRDILNTLVEELDGRLREGALQGGMLARLRPRRRGGPLAAAARCPVCEAEAQAAGRALDVLALHAESAAVEAALRGAAPLCLPHARIALSRGRPSAALREHQRRGWSALRDRLLEFIRKSDHNHRWDKLTDAERAAIVGGVRAVTGARARPGDDVRAETRKLRRGGTNAVRANRRRRGSRPPGG